MSYREAIEDGVMCLKDKQGFNMYYPSCHVCGASVPSWGYTRGLKYTCPECKKFLAQITLEQRNDDTKAEKLKIAVKRISRVAAIEEYKSAIDWVQRNLGKKGWFQSTEEIMVAIELIKNKVNANHQVKIRGYIADFVLPDYKVVLEIDGAVYHAKSREHEQLMRDEIITDAMGRGWQIIHIDTVNINTNVTRLMPAIRKILQYRKCAR